MSNRAVDIAGPIAEAGAQYVDARWLGGQPEKVRAEWRARVFDALFAGVVYGIEQFERGRNGCRERRVRRLWWCLKCKRPLHVGKDRAGEAVTCGTCGFRQQAPAGSGGG